MDASQIVLTAEGRQKLVEELAWREGDYAKEIVEDIKEARAFGDLSETPSTTPLRTSRPRTPLVLPRSRPSSPTLRLLPPRAT